MILEEVIEEIKKMFWGVLKGQFSPDEEEDIKTRLITALAQLTAYAKTVLPIEQQEQYELQFSKAKDILLKFDSAGPWFQELPEMVNTVYNVITYASMLQIECRRHNAVENEVVQYFNQKIEMKCKYLTRHSRNQINLVLRHSRARGNPERSANILLLNHWIPACAGTTEKGGPYF